jgi:hypothetical protein
MKQAAMMTLPDSVEVIPSDEDRVDHACEL